MLAVTTFQRPGVSYLTATLASLDADVEVFDGTGQPYGSRGNKWCVFKAAAARGVERLIVFEDDILACKNLVPFLERLPLPDDVGVVQGFSIGDDWKPWEEVPAGIHKLTLRDWGTGFAGSLCLVFPGEVVRFLAEVDPWHPDMALRGPHNADYAIGYWVSRSPRPMKLLVAPALVHHVGDVSACHQERRQRLGIPTPKVAARPLEFDCLTLLDEQVRAA